MPNDSNSNKIISFDKVSKVYEPGGEPALREVSFSVTTGEFVCIIGPSGGGKSTLLKIIAGLESASSGSVFKPDNVSMVFQAGALFPWLNVFENVALGLRLKRLPETKIRAQSLAYIEMMKLGGMEEKYPRELSGGQSQRVGIARALTVDPAVLLLDEPFSALDPQTTEELHEDVIKVWRETKKTIVMVSHLIEEAVSLADRIFLIRNYALENIFPVTLPRPRRENEEKFAHEVLLIRKKFFKK